MSQDLNTIGIQALKIVPFFIFVIFYFTLVHDDTNLFLVTFLKCAPIICLMIFVVIKGTEFTAAYKYSLFILNGLLFSCIGDLLLTIGDVLFNPALVLYGGAHFVYFLAFNIDELKPWKICFCIPFYAGATKMNVYLYPYMSNVSQFVVPIYSFFLATMCWRSFARPIRKNTILTSVCAFGCLAFFISASLFAISKFSKPIGYDKNYFYSVLTYYIAQFCIALSTLGDIKTGSPQVTTA